MTNTTRDMNPLARWMLRERLTVVEVAAALGVSRFAVHRWLSGSRRPDRDSANRITRLTGIPADSWSRRQRRAAA